MKKFIQIQLSSLELLDDSINQSCIQVETSIKKKRSQIALIRNSVAHFHGQKIKIQYEQLMGHIKVFFHVFLGRNQNLKCIKVEEQYQSPLISLNKVISQPQFKLNLNVIVDQELQSSVSSQSKSNQDWEYHQHLNLPNSPQTAVQNQSFQFQKLNLSYSVKARAVSPTKQLYINQRKSDRQMDQSKRRAYLIVLAMMVGAIAAFLSL